MQISGLWQPKFRIAPKHKVVTAGSCFAQHFSRALAARGYKWFDAEPAPLFLSDEDAAAYNYGTFSFRTGNIYTARMLRQWLSYAFGEAKLPTEVWEQDGRFYDPLRPAIEPGGFDSAEELVNSRAATLAAIRKAVTQTDIFVFTMGLTECWRNRDTGLEYAMCPGTLAGEFDAEQHDFVNQGFGEILKDMRVCLRILQAQNADIRVLLTVSPVPLTATASGQHVLLATSHSKSILRAVAGELAGSCQFADYFPSYEIITHPVFGGMFFAPNKRSVVPQGVNFVMDNFFADQDATFPSRRKRRRRAEAPVPRRGKLAQSAPERSHAALKCEEETLNAFAG